MKSFFLIIFFAHASIVSAASFDCSKSSTDVERLVCKTPVLSVLDDCIRHEYKEIFKHANADQKSVLVAGQNHWLKQKRNKCKDEGCLKETSFSRWDELKVISSNMGISQIKGAALNQMQAVNLNGPILKANEIQELMSNSFDQLKERHAVAHDVIFNSRNSAVNVLCREFWSSLKYKNDSAVPNFDELVMSRDEKERFAQLVSRQQFIKNTSALRGGNKILVGSAVFNNKQVSWELEAVIWSDPSPKELEEEIGYADGDGFRDYEVFVKFLNDPNAGKRKMACNIKFN